VNSNYDKYLPVFKYKEWFEIQNLVFEKFDKSKNLVIKSKTGSGKTLSYLLPIVERILANKEERALILCPTIELVNQISSVAHSISNEVSSKKLTSLIQGEIKANIVIGTIFKVQKAVIANQLNLKNFKYVVYEEADMMLNDEFLEDLGYFYSSIENCKQILVSASMNTTCLGFIKNNFGTSLLLEASDTKLDIVFKDYKIYQKSRMDALKDIVKQLNPYLCIIFCSKKQDIQLIYNELKEDRSIIAYSSNIQTSRRNQLFKEIMAGKYQFLVTSDLMSRGLDFVASHIINYDIPNNKEFFMHRVGRTARANTKGIVYTILTGRDMEFYTKFTSKVGSVQVQADKRSSKQNPKIQLAINALEKPTKVRPNYKKKRKEQILKIIKKVKKEDKYHKYIQTGQKQQ
jgi:ATP-dependent RNA helicase CshB